MKINHILEDYSLKSGGIRTVVKDLTTHIPFETQVLTLEAEKKDNNVTCFEYKLPWKFSRELNKHLHQIEEDNISKIFHIHGVWMYPQFISAKIANNSKSPYILTPHGMYEPWLWEQGRIKKKLYFNLLAKKYFKEANVIHAITQVEKNNLHKLFPKHKNIEVIPNLISTCIIPKIKDQNVNEKYILFLGRIHPKKGIKLLIDSFSEIQQSKFKLKIAGPESEHKIELIKYVEKLGLKNKIEFVGMIKGDAKFSLYKNAHVFVAPSYSEVIGMVNLEAAIMGTPVITTYQTGLYSDWNKEGGVLINPEYVALKKALTNALSWSEEERADRGRKLKEFVLEKYSWERNLNKWKSLYKSL